MRYTYVQVVNLLYAHVYMHVVSHGQTLLLHRGVIAFGIGVLLKTESGWVYSTHSYWGQQILFSINWLHVILSACTLVGSKLDDKQMWIM